jgi:hypothetical protein
MHTLFVTLIASLLCAGYSASTAAQVLAEQGTRSQNADNPVLIYQVKTKYLQNISPQGGYTQVKFTNTGERTLSAIAFEVVPYAGGEPILQTVNHPVVFGAKGDFKPGDTYTVTSEKPVWSKPRTRVDCVHLVGLLLEYADGQTKQIGKAEIAGYLRPQIARQNCSHPSAPGAHN